MQPNLSIPLFIVAPDDRREKVFREVNRPTFDRRDQPLKDVCQFIAFSVVREGYDRVKTIATSLKPSIIYQWAEGLRADVTGTFFRGGTIGPERSTRTSVPPSTESAPWASETVATRDGDAHFDRRRPAGTQGAAKVSNLADVVSAH